MRKLKLFFGLILLLLLIGVGSAEVNLMTTMTYDHQVGLVVPAGGSSYNSAPDLIIGQVYFNIGGGQRTDVILHLASGNTISGAVDYRTGFPLSETLDMNFAGQTHSFTSLGVGAKKRIGISYAVDNATESPIYYIAMYQGGNINPLSGYSGIYEPLLLHQISGRPSDDPIIQIDFLTSTGLLNAGLDPGGSGQATDPAATINTMTIAQQSDAENAHETGTGTQLGWLLSIITPVWDAIMLAWSIFYFFFIEHLFLLIILVEGAIFAYELNSKQNVFRAFSAIAQDNIKIFEFAVGAVQKIISLTWDLVNLFNPLRWILGK